MTRVTNRLGRLSHNASLSFEMVNPIVIGKNHLSNLLVRKSHFASNHIGSGSTLNHLRLSGFWLVSARQIIMPCEIVLCVIGINYSRALSRVSKGAG